MTTGKSTRHIIVSGMNLDAGIKNKLGRKTRYVYLVVEPWPKFSGMAKVDLVTGNVTKFYKGNKRFGGEPCFVPVGNGEKEDEGYIMSYARDEDKDRSELVIVDALRVGLPFIRIDPLAELRQPNIQQCHFPPKSNDLSTSSSKQLIKNKRAIKDLAIRNEGRLNITNENWHN
ncbi:9-cis-epoxycarotenoid dioxygenase NCED6, chloroplastic [Tanacetum coccineum]